jgi:ATP-dependent Zn protease
MTNSISNNKQSYENIYNNLKEYMFYPDVIHRNMNIDHHNSLSINNKKTYDNNKLTKIVKEEQEDTSPFFIPQEKDKLFWCLYTFIHGEYEYKIAKNNRNTFTIEKKWKIDTLAKLKEKDVIDEKISKLEQLINSLKDTNDTGKYGVKDLETQFNDSTWWYYLLIIVNVVLFIIFSVLFYKNLSSNSLKDKQNYALYTGKVLDRTLKGSSSKTKELTIDTLDYSASGMTISKTIYSVSNYSFPSISSLLFGYN